MSQVADSLSKRFEGRNEAIPDPGLPIIEAHHHLYERPGLHYMLDDYLADATAGHNIDQHNDGGRSEYQ